MAAYTLLASRSSIQVLSPDVIRDTVTADVQTHPSGVRASVWVSRDDFDAGTAHYTLQAFAQNVEHLMASDKVSAAVGSQRLDDSGLLAQTVEFTVSYKQPGSGGLPLEADAEVPVNDLVSFAEDGTNLGLDAAQQIIDSVYASLVSLAGGSV